MSNRITLWPDPIRAILCVGWDIVNSCGSILLIWPTSLEGAPGIRSRSTACCHYLVSRGVLRGGGTQ